MYGRGHEHGTRRQRSTGSEWYTTIEAATLATLDAAWPETNTTPQEVTRENTQDADSTHHETGP